MIERPGERRSRQIPVGRLWYEDLSPEDQEDVLEEARSRARKNGYTEDRSRSFSAGVMQMISRIHQERAAGDGDG